MRLPCIVHVRDGRHGVTVQDSNWHSTEGDKRDDLSDNSWFKNTQKLAGDKKFIKKTGNWACK